MSDDAKRRAIDDSGSQTRAGSAVGSGRSQAVAMIAITSVATVGLGMILFPGWYGDLFSGDGGIEFFVLGGWARFVAMYVGIGLGAYVVFSFRDRAPVVRWALEHSRLYPILAGVLLVASMRVQVARLLYRMDQITAIAAEVDSKAAVPPQAVGNEPLPDQAPTVPIDPIYLNVSKIDDCYSQYQEGLVVVSRVTEDGAILATEANVGGGSVGGMSVEGQESARSAATFQPQETTTVRKLLDIRRYLTRSALLLEVETIDRVSSKYADFLTLERRLKEEYLVELRADQAKAVRERLLKDELAEGVRERFPAGQWVLASGPFAARRSGDRTEFVLDYVPGLAGAVVVAASVPTKELGTGALELVDGSPWELKVFGKVAKVGPKPIPAPAPPASSALTQGYRAAYARTPNTRPAPAVSQGSAPSLVITLETYAVFR